MLKTKAKRSAYIVELHVGDCSFVVQIFEQYKVFAQMLVIYLWKGKKARLLHCPVRDRKRQWLIN